MLYRKNLPTWERWARAILGIALIAYAVFGGPSAALLISALASAAVVIVTGFVGWCPVCALAGRKPVEPNTDRTT